MSDDCFCSSCVTPLVEGYTICTFVFVSLADQFVTERSVTTLSNILLSLRLNHLNSSYLGAMTAGALLPGEVLHDQLRQHNFVVCRLTLALFFRLQPQLSSPFLVTCWLLFSLLQQGGQSRYCQKNNVSASQSSLVPNVCTMQLYTNI